MSVANFGLDFYPPSPLANAACRSPRWTLCLLARLSTVATPLNDPLERILGFCRFRRLPHLHALGVLLQHPLAQPIQHVLEGQLRWRQLGTSASMASKSMSDSLKRLASIVRAPASCCSKNSQRMIDWPPAMSMRLYIQVRISGSNAPEVLCLRQKP